MTGHLVRRSAIVIAATLALSSPMGAQSGHELFQQALSKERAEGKLQEAIALYQRVVEVAAADHALAAKALLQLGRCYETLGNTEARTAYERLIARYPDQTDLVAQARSRLAALVRLDALAKVAAAGASPARRLVVDWMEWYRTKGYAFTKLTRDGRHLLRYNGEKRAFEQVEIGTGGVRRLTSDGPNPAEALPEYRGGNSELSPDGRRLAAMVGLPKPGPAVGPEPQPEPQFERVELRVFEVGGRGTGRVLATWDAQALGQFRVRPFAWSPRNDRIWLVVFRKDQSAQIASVDMSGKLEVLKTLAWRNHSHTPSLSPDGMFLAYHDAPDRQAPPDLFILATDGSREQRLEQPADDSKPMFAPDGSGVVFESNRRGARDLWFQAVADGRPMGQPRLVWRNVGAFGTADRFADNGSLYYFFATTDWGTYRVPLDLKAVGGAVGEPTRVAPVANEANSGAAFSPDGHYLAHFRANAARLVIRELATGVEREIPFGAQLSSGYALADWCPASDALIAVGYQDGPVAYRVNVKDSSAQRLPIAPDSAALCVGDGQEVIYVPFGARDSIVRRSLVSGRETTIFKGEARAFARSVDGTRLAVVAFDPNAGVARLVTMSAAGGDVSADLMVSGTGPGPLRRMPLLQDVVWMPGGDRLLVIRYDEGQSIAEQAQQPSWLWEVPLSGAAPRKLGLLRVAFIGPGRKSFSVHPDGKQLAFQHSEGVVQQTWAIDNLLQFIKAGGGW